MEDLKIFEDVSLECDEKGTAPYQGGHSHGTVGLIDVEPGATIPFEEYRSLSPDACAERVRAARATLGDRLVLLVHHYQRDDVYRHADLTGDSFLLSRQAADSDAETIVFCGVHFMAETAAILSRPDQRVILPDLSAGCSMADMADIEQVEDAWAALAEALGEPPETRVTPITYMNSTADLKAFCGRHGGIVCTSSNAGAVMRWAFERREKLLFFPDQHLGRNTAKANGVSLDDMVLWRPTLPGGGVDPAALARARVILWEGHCSVHAVFQPEHVDAIREKRPEIDVLVHPECRMEVVDKADHVGSTEVIRKTIENAGPGSEWAIGTEIHMVNRLKEQHPDKGVWFLSPTVCMCATMYRIDQPHLAWTLENLVAGHVVNEVAVEPETARLARVALDRMLAVS
ncbi:MAG: quinolinate synthase NadA [Gemmatimonadetes bacterium]|nr:quinolinate synthase NadA [Gemmatimonadota bacterium]